MSADIPPDPVPDPVPDAALDAAPDAAPDPVPDPVPDPALDPALDAAGDAARVPTNGPASSDSADDRDPRPDDAERPRGRAYRAEGITVYFDPRAFWHTGDCLRGLPHVFDVRRRPWVRADLDTPERIAKQVEACPSGALQFELPGDAE